MLLYEWHSLCSDLLVRYSDGDDKRGIELAPVCMNSCRFRDGNSISLAHKRSRDI